MSRVYDAVEPSVIDEILLKSCVEEQGPKGEAGVIAKKEGIDFKDVAELRLDFKSNDCFFVIILKKCHLLTITVKTNQNWSY